MVWVTYGLRVTHITYVVLYPFCLVFLHIRLIYLIHFFCFNQINKLINSKAILISNKKYQTEVKNRTGQAKAAFQLDVFTMAIVSFWDSVS